MNETIRIGFVGAGSVVRHRHLPNLKKLEGVELVSVCNRTLASSEDVAQQYDIGKIYEHWKDLVHSEEIDAVWIGAWPYLHHPVTLEALAAGKHVFCQARMAMHAAQAREMLEAAQVRGKVAMLCPPPMGMKGDRWMQKLIREDFLGEIYSIHLTAMNNGLLDPALPLSWRQREDLSGVNTLFVGIYAEVIHRWFGYARDVTAQAKTFIPRRPVATGQTAVTGETASVSRPDVVFCVGEMLCGALLRAEWSALAGPAPAAELTVYGSRGALRYLLDTDEIKASSAGAAWERMEIPPEWIREWTVEQDFVEAVRTGKDVHPDFYDGLKYMEFTEAVFQSALSGQRITLMR